MMKENDILTLTIADIGMHGEGIAKHEGHTVFVPFALPHEEVLAKVTHIDRHGLVYAALQRVLTPSPMRVTPICNRYMRCGGCDLMHADYAYQLEVKAYEVATTLRKAGVVCDVLPTVPSPKTVAYRNKIMLPFGIVEGKVAVGFYREGTHQLVRLTKCPLHAQWAEIIINATLQFVDTYCLSVYDSATGKGLLRHLVVRKMGDHLDITLVINSDRLPHWTEYINAVHAVWPDFSLYISPNLRRNNVIMGDKIFLRWGNPYVHDVMGVKVAINPLSFLQVNDDICHAIYTKVCQAVAPKEGSVVVDAFAGVGILGAIMAKEGATVYNIEIVPEATVDGDRLAQQNGLKKVHNINGDSAEVLPQLLHSLRADAPMVHKMKLRTPYFESIAAGSKTYELRLFDEKRRIIKVGDLVQFTAEDGRTLYCKVNEMRTFDSFRTLFTTMGTATSWSRDVDIDEAVEGMGAFYSPEQQKEYGVVAIGIQPVNVAGLNVVLDPPRKGCSDVADTLVSLAEPAPLSAPHWPVIRLPLIQQIVYISCNPATLARDLAKLQTAYTIDSVQPYDMFPQTRHIETVVLMSKVEEK